MTAPAVLARAGMSRTKIHPTGRGRQSRLESNGLSGSLWPAYGVRGAAIDGSVTTGQTSPGEEFYSALIAEGAELRRAIFPRGVARTAARGDRLVEVAVADHADAKNRAPNEVLLQFFDELAGQPDKQDMRYVLGVAAGAAASDAAGGGTARRLGREMCVARIVRGAIRTTRSRRCCRMPRGEADSAGAGEAVGSSGDVVRVVGRQRPAGKRDQLLRPRLPCDRRCCLCWSVGAVRLERVGLRGCGCGSRPRCPSGAAPIADVEQVIQAVNRNSRQIQSFSTSSATLSGPGLPDAASQHRLSAAAILSPAGRDRAYRPGGRPGQQRPDLLVLGPPHEPPAVYFCRHDQFRSAGPGR